MEYMRSVHLKSGNTNEICWIEDRPKLKKGKFITLKDEGDLKRWEILWLGSNCVDKSTLYKPWKVGGL